MTPEQIITRANAAERVLDDPLVKEALATIEAQIIEAFHDCPARDMEAMRILQSELRRCRKFKDILRGAIERGKLAANDLLEKENMLQRTVRRFRE